MNSTVTSGLSASTPKNILVNEGAVYANYGLANEKLLGAVSGANEFMYKRDMWSVDVCGSVSKHNKGLEFPKEIEATLKCSFVEMTEDLLKMSLFASIDTTTNVGYDTLIPKAHIESIDYLDNIALVGEISGSEKPVIIILKNVLIVDGINIKRENAKTNTLDVTFTAFGDPANPKIIPVEVRYPSDNVPTA